MQGVVLAHHVEKKKVTEIGKKKVLSGFIGRYSLSEKKGKLQGS